MLYTAISVIALVLADPPTLIDAAIVVAVSCLACWTADAVVSALVAEK